MTAVEGPAVEGTAIQAEQMIPTPDNNLNDEHPVGYGRMLRKEDQRFIRGRGQYVDDVVVPGMLHLAILRSPYAHARIVSIDTSAAIAHPRVKAVVTGEDLAAHNLAWMPTLSNDVQAVLATDKVRFQHQEVAFVVAEDRYSARDALELIDVTYEPLPRTPRSPRPTSWSPRTCSTRARTRRRWRRAGRSPTWTR